MRIISHDDICRLNISPLQCFHWAETMIKNKDAAILPAKISLKPMDGVFYNTMPVLLPPYDWGGVKVVNRYPGREPSLDSKILLYRISTGEPLALMDGNYITAMRTGAVAAHSIELLAKKNFTTIGMLGLGNTARATLKVLLALYPERTWTVKLLQYKNQHVLFHEAFAAHNHIEFVYCTSAEALVSGSDVIVSAATVLQEDICADSFFDEGCLVVPIHTRGFTNCDLFFDKVFADDTNHVKGFKHFDRFKSFAETSDVLNGKAEGRTNDKQRILAYNIGIASHDLYFAGQIFSMLPAGKELSIGLPETKFWV